MRKGLLTAIALMLVISSLTACRENVVDNKEPITGAADGGVSKLINYAPISRPDDNKSDNIKPDDSKTDDNNANDGKPDEKPAEKTRYVFGETTIPDIHCEDCDIEGKAVMYQILPVPQSLDSMVFETYTLGEYTLRLVGDSVRTDEANFPGSIYAQDLRVEVERGGEIVDSVYYNSLLQYLAQFTPEHRLFADKIGSYLDVYDMELPLIAMRYYFGDESDRTVFKAVEFAAIQEGSPLGGHVGVCESGTGVTLNEEPGDKAYTCITVNSGKTNCRLGIFGSDEFTVADKKTLIDEEAGIKYTFNFAQPLEFELFAAEKIN